MNPEELLIKIKKAFEDGNEDEASTLLKSIFDAEYSEEEQGRILADYTTLYMKMMNEVDAQYVTSLQEINADLTELVSQKKLLEEKKNVIALKKELAEVGK